MTCYRRHIILPSTFLGGDRHQHQLYQDAMSVFGKPKDIFICNPNWPEMLSELKPFETLHYINIYTKIMIV